MKKKAEEKLISLAMSFLGKRKSKAKSEAAKKNGKKGGRPKNPPKDLGS